MSEHAQRWADAMRRARTLRPDLIASRIAGAADTGLRATRYDAMGGRTTRTPCEDPQRCDDGPEEHSHLVSSDPTGNAAVRERQSDDTDVELTRLRTAEADFIRASGVVLDWVCGIRPTKWASVLTVNASLMPGTVQAGLDVDHHRHLPGAIETVERAVATVAGIARDHLPRAPSQDEQHWTAGLGPNDVCVWHAGIHTRYRRPRLPGKNICQDCANLVMLGEGAKPPQWLLEAEVDRLSKPRAWLVALGRWLDELGIEREAS